MNTDEKVSFGEAYLEHVGIKGMRWGVRKSQPTTGNSPKTGPGKIVLSSKNKKRVIAAGAVAAAAILQKNGLLIPALSKTASGAVYVASLLGNVGLEVVGKPFFMLYKPPIL